VPLLSTRTGVTAVGVAVPVVAVVVTAVDKVVVTVSAVVRAVVDVPALVDVDVEVGCVAFVAFVAVEVAVVRVEVEDEVDVAVLVVVAVVVVVVAVVVVVVAVVVVRGVEDAGTTNAVRLEHEHTISPAIVTMASLALQVNSQNPPRPRTTLQSTHPTRPALVQVWHAG
jgi:hypothetical protein